MIQHCGFRRMAISSGRIFPIPRDRRRFQNSNCWLPHDQGALGWIRGLRHSKLLMMWERFPKDLRGWFGALGFEASGFEDKLELSHLQQMLTMTNYLEQFKTLFDHFFNRRSQIGVEK